MTKPALNQVGNTPFTTSVLASLYPDIRQINDKARRLEQDGHIVRLKRGLYVRSAADGATIIPMLIANHIYGPSYVSMHTALRHYRLIPERVYETQSMTIKHTYLVASPEKALCDLIVKSSGLTATSIKSIKSWLTEDLRFDMDALSHFDVTLLELCGKHAPVKNNIITLLTRLVLL